MDGHPICLEVIGKTPNNVLGHVEIPKVLENGAIRIENRKLPDPVKAEDTLRWARAIALACFLIRQVRGAVGSRFE